MTNLVQFSEAFPLVKVWREGWPLEAELVTDKHVADPAAGLQS
jgi:hypothetical protein